jgi:branched-subunit amino acid ABC-type transport system permease component
MIESIVSTGVAIGCIYALIGITYNVMFSASRVFSFTAGTLGMLGGVLGALFIAHFGLSRRALSWFWLPARASASSPRSSPCGRCCAVWTSISTCCPRWRWH